MTRWIGCATSLAAATLGLTLFRVPGARAASTPPVKVADVPSAPWLPYELVTSSDGTLFQLNGRALAVSQDLGRSFREHPLPFAEPAYGSLSLEPSGAVFLVGRSGDHLSFSRSLDGGLTWQLPIDLGLPWSPSSLVVIAGSVSERVAVTAVDPVARTTVVITSSDGGSSFGPAVTVTVSPWGTSFLRLTWAAEDDLPACFEAHHPLQCRVSRDGGAASGAALRVSLR